MARKRYETAFLPSAGCDPNGLRLPSPDADTLLLAVEGMSPKFYRCTKYKSPEKLITQRQFAMEYPDNSSQLQNRPSLSLSKELSSLQQYSNTGIEPPMSAPLRTKRYTLQTCYSDDVNANDETSVSVVTKGASISSLESLDSAQSEDFHLKSRTSLYRRQTPPSRIDKNLAYKQHEKVMAVSTLSPIADKSPLDPFPAFQQQHSQSGLSPYHTGVANVDNGLRNSDATMNLMTAYELTNVPWEMPKLRRKLARLVDSGISLDATPPSNRHQNLEFYPYNNANSAPESEVNNGSADSLLNMQQQQGCSTGRNANFEGCSEQFEKRFNLDLKIPSVSANTSGFPPRRPLVRQDTEDARPEEDDEEHRGQHNPAHVYLDFEEHSLRVSRRISFDPDLDLEFQDWFFGAINRAEAEHILRRTVEGSFLVRNCESHNFNKYSLSLKCSRGIIHIRIEPNSYGTYSLGDQEFASVPQLVVHFMQHRLPIKGAEHIKLLYPIIQKLL